jgi:hypothetical protein
MAHEDPLSSPVHNQAFALLADRIQPAGATQKVGLLRFTWQRNSLLRRTKSATQPHHSNQRQEVAQPRRFPHPKSCKSVAFRHSKITNCDGSHSHRSEGMQPSALKDVKDSLRMLVAR